MIIQTSWYSKTSFALLADVCIYGMTVNNRLWISIYLVVASLVDDLALMTFKITL